MAVTNVFLIRDHYDMEISCFGCSIINVLINYVILTITICCSGYFTKAIKLQPGLQKQRPHIGQRETQGVWLFSQANSYHVFILCYKHSGCWENTRKKLKHFLVFTHVFITGNRGIENVFCCSDTVIKHQNG